jgi:hypothetical protein
MLTNNLTTQQACQIKINNLWTMTVPDKGYSRNDLGALT